MNQSREAAVPQEPAGSPAWVVLHVDDDPNDAELLRAAALKSGVKFRVITVGDGEEARSYLERAASPAEGAADPFPSLILLDLKMPRATGLELLRWIRSRPELADVPVLVFSGSALHEDVRQAGLAGANAYHVKPLGFQALVRLAREIEDQWLKPRG